MWDWVSLLWLRREHWRKLRVRSCRSISLSRTPLRLLRRGIKVDNMNLKLCRDNILLMWFPCSMKLKSFNGWRKTSLLQWILRIPQPNKDSERGSRFGICIMLNGQGWKWCYFCKNGNMKPNKHLQWQGRLMNRFNCWIKNWPISRILSWSCVMHQSWG